MKSGRFVTYMLRCSDDSFYIGHTDNIEQRLSLHQSGKINGYTAQRLPVKLVWMERFHNRHEAFVVERKIKGWSRKKKAALINNDWETICKLSRE